MECVVQRPDGTRIECDKADLAEVLRACGDGAKSTPAMIVWQGDDEYWIERADQGFRWRRVGAVEWGGWWADARGAVTNLRQGCRAGIDSLLDGARAERDRNREALRILGCPEGGEWDVIAWAEQEVARRPKAEWNDHLAECCRKCREALTVLGWPGWPEDPEAWVKDAEVDLAAARVTWLTGLFRNLAMVAGLEPPHLGDEHTFTDLAVRLQERLNRYPAEPGPARVGRVVRFRDLREGEVGFDAVEPSDAWQPYAIHIADGWSWARNDSNYSLRPLTDIFDTVEAVTIIAEGCKTREDVRAAIAAHEKARAK